MQNSVPQYVVNIDEIAILFDLIGVGGLKRENLFYFSTFEILDFSQKNRTFFLPVQQKSGFFSSLELVGLFDGEVRIKVSIDDEVLLDGFAIKEKLTFPFPANLDFQKTPLLTVEVGEGTEEGRLYLNLLGYKRKEEDFDLLNCEIYLDEDLFAFRVPVNTSYTFKPPSQYKGKSIVGIKTPMLQTLDRYGFNATIPDFKDKMIFKFSYF